MMKAVVNKLMVFLFLVLLLSLPLSAAQEGDGEGEGEEEDTGDEEGCILATFCVIMLFVLYLIYYATRRKRETSGGRQAGQPSYPPPGREYRFPVPHKPYPSTQTRPYPSAPEPQKKDVKCDLCRSKNLRFFEKGYVKCNDCRHVFYISEGYSSKRGR
ncbi:MAG: hypothetical protein JSW00_17550 [Thermoplasmata archaeon]|nr:MAG: hypothetical protein JSW00_17550 [Thermoplasmata archaeon]